MTNNDCYPFFASVAGGLKSVNTDAAGSSRPYSMPTSANPSSRARGVTLPALQALPVLDAVV
jgi:hypothetical protein